MLSASWQAYAYTKTTHSACRASCRKYIDMDGQKTEEGSSSGSLLDPYALLKIVRNPDGSITRLLSIPEVPTRTQPPDQTHQQQPAAYVLSKDIPLNPSNHTWMRIYRPHLPVAPTNAPLPVIIYFHGGGFYICSPATPFFHDCCERLAIQVPAIVLSVDYRLVPEHRLPAAYHDGMDAVLWVKDQAQAALREPWMAPEIVDFSRCFLMGNSAGGNLAYYLWRQLALDPENHPRFKIAGVILDQPFFGGVERTASELRMADDSVLPILATDLIWKLALPEGADRDHEFSNPETLEKKKGNSSGSEVTCLPPCLLMASAYDPLVDRQRALTKMLEEKGVKVVAKFADDGYHGVQFYEAEKGEILVMEVKDFVSSVISC